MNTTLDQDTFQDRIKQAVAAALDHKEEKTRLAALEAAVTDASDTVKELSEELSASAAEMLVKDEQLKALKEDKAALEATVEDLTAKHAEIAANTAEAATALEAAQERATAAEAKLADIEAAAKLLERMGKLEEANVAKAGEARESQEAYVRGLSDEAFGSYLEERVTMRSEILEQLKTETAKEAEAVDVTPPPADLDEMRNENAAAVAAGAINTETDEKDVFKAYAAFGEALAAMSAPSTGKDNK